jgi:hypothetical protein
MQSSDSVCVNFCFWNNCWTYHKLGTHLGSNDSGSIFYWGIGLCSQGKLWSELSSVRFVL